MSGIQEEILKFTDRQKCTVRAYEVASSDTTCNAGVPPGGQLDLGCFASAAAPC